MSKIGHRFDIRLFRWKPSKVVAVIYRFRFSRLSRERCHSDSFDRPNIVGPLRASFGRNPSGENRAIFAAGIPRCCSEHVIPNLTEEGEESLSMPALTSIKVEIPPPAGRRNDKCSLWFFGLQPLATRNDSFQASALAKARRAQIYKITGYSSVL